MTGDIVRIKEGSEEGEWLGHVQCDRGMCTGLSGIPNHNGQGTPILGGNTVDISTVVTSGFWLCQFNTGSLAWGLLFVIDDWVFCLVVAI